MARIYIGRSTGIGAFERHVVLKMITPERANDLTAVNMFLDEARLAASLNHQNVAQVFEVGEEGGIHYLAMEYVHGQDMRALLAKAGGQGTRIPLELALTVVAGAAAGLHHAHERRGPDGTPLGIVHRDVSPSNIMIGYDGAVKLLDFGIAKATARSVETQSGIIKGKFAYMAPEQCRGRDVDRRSDVFSLGIILYEISTQHRCFRADSDFDTMHRIVTGDVVRPTRIVQGYPQALEAIVMKALAIDPAQRYQSAGMLLEALENFAVASRMSLSTMGLGRFMRDMFGEVSEPWLNTAATKLLQPVAARENTISSTDGRSSGSQRVLAPETLPPETFGDGMSEDDGRFVDSAGIEAAASTVLDLPRGAGQADHDDAGRPEWNAKSYPSMRPQMNAAEALGSELPPGLPGMMPPARSTPAGGIPEQGGAMPAGTPRIPGTPDRRSGPLSSQFASVPGSGSSPSHPAIVSTKHGYAGGAGATRDDASYPVVSTDALDEIQLKPNRRPLFIGMGIVIVGVAVLLVVAFGGGESVRDPGLRPIDEPRDQPAVVPDPDPTPPDPAGDPPLDENMVSVIIESDPPGADVLIAGAKIGTTPFNDRLKRGTKVTQLTVRKSGYVDFVGKIDLGGEYENRKIKLLTVEEAAAKAAGEATGTGSAGSASDGDAGDAGDDSGGTSVKDGTTTQQGTTTKQGTATKPGGAGTAGTKNTGTKGTGSKPKEPSEPREPKEPKCQPPGPNVDPFSSVPVCKS
jgi:serine/threonine protein kinase